MMRRLGLTVLAAALLAGMSGAALARITPQTALLADPQLFIAPSGQPYRSLAGEPYPVVAWFNKTDTNHDGKIDRAEFKAEAEGFFHQLDIHKDGIVDDQIIGLYEKRVVPEILAGVTGAAFRTKGGTAKLQKVQLGGLGQLGGPPVIEAPPQRFGDYHPGELPTGAAAYGLLNDAEPLRSADRSFRGVIKLQDMLDQADRNFDLLDVAKRGYLTLEDLPRTPAQLQARPAHGR